MAALTESIRREGVMQPVIVRRVPGEVGGYELVAGERRWRAAGGAGLETVPAIVRELDDAGAAEWGLVENLQREDLDPMERAHGLRALAMRFGLSHAEVADRVGMERSSVTNLMRLTELEPGIQMLLSEGALTMGHARALLTMGSGEAREALARRAAEEGWSVRRVEEAAQGGDPVARDAGRTASAGGVGGGAGGQRAAVVADLERRLSAHLGTKVKIRTNIRGTRGRVSAEFYSLEHFEDLLRRMGVNGE